jgi:hypothetical protein
MAVLRFPLPAADAYEATTTKTLWTWPGSSRRIASGCTPWTSGSFFFIGPARTANSERQAASLPRYLDDLECPYEVLARGRGEEIEKEDEHDDDDAVARESRPQHPPDAFLRLCALYRLVVVCAASEAYGEDATRADSGGAPAPELPTTTTLLNDGYRAPQAEGFDEEEEESLLLLGRLDRAFPLGFTCGDSEVDRALVVTRMIPLVELEDEDEDETRFCVAV